MKNYIINIESDMPFGLSSEDVDFIKKQLNHRYSYLFKVKDIKEGPIDNFNKRGNE